jgi:hypothetical protein
VRACPALINRVCTSNNHHLDQVGRAGTAISTRRATASTTVACRAGSGATAARATTSGGAGRALP